MPDTSLMDRYRNRPLRRITHRTRQLPLRSRVLYKIEHYSSHPRVAVTIPFALVGLIALGAVLGFPGHWVSAFEVLTTAFTLVMVFAIQHTQGREQAATQRKLDELLRALPGASESLMMLEEASEDELLGVEENQRALREKLVQKHKRWADDKEQSPGPEPRRR